MRTVRFLFLIFILTIANVVSYAQTPAYKIAYNIYNKDSMHGYEVYMMDMDGKNKTNISNHKDVAWTYYAYKNRLYFVSDRDTCYRCYFLYETDANDKQIRKVSNLQLEDSWMSSRNHGKEMIVSGRLGKERMQLFIIDPESGHYKQITHDTAAMYRDPLFSPDGNKIIFAYKQNRRDRKQHEELYTMNADGTNLQQLTHYPADDTLISSFGYKAGPPRWHPTGNFISYISEQAGKTSIYAVTPDGSKQWKLTDHLLNEGWHDWSPDGKWLAFDLSDKEGKQYHIMLMNWKTKEVKQLTDNRFTTQMAPVFVVAE